MNPIFLALYILGVSPDEPMCWKSGAPIEQNEYVIYASHISNGDLKFLATLEAENSLWSPDRQSNVVKKGKREESYGFCQINKKYHPEIIGDERFFTDPFWQLDTCWKMYKGGVKFYGKAKAEKLKKRFICL